MFIVTIILLILARFSKRLQTFSRQQKHTVILPSTAVASAVQTTETTIH